MRAILISLLIITLPLVALTQNSVKRIVSLAPSLTKSIYYLQGDDLIVGHTTYCHIAENDDKDVVATAVKVNIEKVVTLRPDLVIATTITNPETIDMLKKGGFRVEVFPTPKNFDETCRQFEKLGKIIGKEELAKSITKDVEQKVMKISKELSSPSSPKIFFQIGAKPIFTVLENTFMNDYITLIGGKNIAAGLTRGQVTREFVITANPDYIFIVTMGIVGDQEKKEWQRYSNLNAVKNNRVFMIETDMASTPTPPDFLRTMQTISEFIK